MTSSDGFSAPINQEVVFGTFKAIIHNEETGGYWAEVPAFPGCATQGEAMDELLANLREAIEGWLAVDAASA